MLMICFFDAVFSVSVWDGGLAAGETASSTSLTWSGDCSSGDRSSMALLLSIFDNFELELEAEDVLLDIELILS